MTKPITPLRQRMLDDMALRNMSPATQRVYINAVKNFSVFFGRSPDKLTFEDVRTYQLHLVSRGLKPTTIHPILYALRFFYRTTLGRSGVTEQISPPRRPDPLPPVLAPEEIVRFLKAVPGLKPRTALTTVYATGLRVAEAVSLTIKDIDSARMVIHVRHGKGGRDGSVRARANKYCLSWDEPIQGHAACKMASTVAVLRRWRSLRRSAGTYWLWRE